MDQYVHEFLYNVIFSYLRFYDKHTFQKLNKYTYKIYIKNLSNIDHKYMHKLNDEIIRNYKFAIKLCARNNPEIANLIMTWKDCVRFNYPQHCIALDLEPIGHILSGQSRTILSLQMYKIIENNNSADINCDMFRSLIVRISRTHNDELIEIFKTGLKNIRDGWKASYFDDFIWLWYNV